MKRKMGWKVFGIIGFVFAPMGALFLLLGLVMGNTSAVSWKYNNDQAVFLAVFGGLGGLFLITGLVFLGIDIRRRMLLRRAYNEGNCVEAEFLGITELRIVNMVQGRPRMAECAWTDGNGVVHVYRSRYLYFLRHGHFLLRNQELLPAV